MNQPVADDSQEIADKVRSGQYFREARAMYDLTVNDMMAERYFYILIAALSGLTFVIAYFAAQSLYPLKRSVPFVVMINDPIEDVPTVTKLRQYAGQDVSEAVLHFLLKNYVKQRESYDIAAFDRNIAGVGSQSTPEVLKELQQQVDVANPESPLALYQRHSRRKIEVSSVVPQNDTAAEVKYIAIVEGKGEARKSAWKANISFQYGGVRLDEKGGKVSALSFIVTDYHTKRVQDQR